MPEVHILIGDVREKLAELPDESVHCVVTSPPYFGLRDYGVAGQIGLEPTPAEFVAVMVEVFREVRRVLRKDGTLWLNLGDSYNANQGAGFDTNQDGGARKKAAASAKTNSGGLPAKNLLGIPWRVAFALQADGWYLRQDIIWSKPNPMPESVTDRCTKAHEYLFLLSKSARYHYDAEAIKEPASENTHSRGSGIGIKNASIEASTGVLHNADYARAINGPTEDRNRRSVWTVATHAFSAAHFATFPPDLIEPCIKAGCPKDCCAKCGAPVVRQVEKSVEWPERRNGKGENKDRADGGMACNAERTVTTTGWSPSCTCDAGLARGTVLDPFGGAGTTGLVADRLQRDAILIELNPEYAAIAKERIHGDGPLFSDVLLAAE